MNELEAIINTLGNIRDDLDSKPKSREISLTITKIDEAMLWAGVELYNSKNSSATSESLPE